MLKDRKSTCDGYTNLFDDLAREMGLESSRIVGYAKGFDYTPGKPLAKPNHSWNAVKLEGKWNLIDATWGAGSVEGNRGLFPYSDHGSIPTFSSSQGTRERSSSRR